MLFRGTRAREIPPKADNIVDPLSRDYYFKRKPFQNKVKVAVKKTLFFISNTHNLINVTKNETIVKHLN